MNFSKLMFTNVVVKVSMVLNACDKLFCIFNVFTLALVLYFIIVLLMIMMWVSAVPGGMFQICSIGKEMSGNFLVSGA